MSWISDAVEGVGDFFGIGGESSSSSDSSGFSFGGLLSDVFEFGKKNPDAVYGGLLATASLLSNSFAADAADEKNSELLAFEREKFEASLAEKQKDRELALALAQLKGGGGGGGGRPSYEGYTLGAKALLEGQQLQNQSYENLVSGTIGALK